MQIRTFLDTMRKRVRLMFFVVLLSVGLAALATYFITPVYESTARLYVSSAQAETTQAYAGGLLSEQRVAAYVQIVDSALLGEQVRDELGLTDSLENIEKKVSANAVGETPVLEIHATGTDPDDAQLLGQTFAEKLVTTAATIETPAGTSSTPVKVTIIDPATEPLAPVFPKPMLNLTLALMFGIVLAIGLALLREVLDNSINEIADLAPEEPPLLGAFVIESSRSQGMLVGDLPTSAPRVESFRMLRTNISFLDVDHPTKLLVVTSPVQGDGKTSIAVNLALSMASANVRTLLVDGDLRRPRVASLLGLVPDVGVTTVLLGRVKLDEAIQQHTPGGLDVLTSGTAPPNAAELLQSEAMEKLLDEFRGRYDMVIIDSPPLLPVTDAAVLATRADGALVVLRHGRTTKDQWRTARSRLQQVDANTLGVVMNLVPTSDSALGYAYGEYKPRTPGRGRRRRP